MLHKVSFKTYLWSDQTAIVDILNIKSNTDKINTVTSIMIYDGKVSF